MAFIVWWFWLWQPRTAARAEQGVVTVSVDDGVYEPARIETHAGEPITLRFVRRDPSPCARQVIFEQLGVTEELPLDRAVDIQLRPDRPGTYRFTCQMQMYQGQLDVRAR